ncbi:MAG: DUF134 domain-containing protein [Spirochaetes bacterium]|nr:MAG: DUF134 domain-containing protein [Spirochaetota bacterium]
MPRPKCCRTIGCVPNANYFSPGGVSPAALEEIVLTLDEFEAVRLACHEALYQEEAAARMGVSRQTFGRIMESAQRKIADVLVNGKALRIGGGDVVVGEPGRPSCPRCSGGRTGGAHGAGCPRCAKLNRNKT